MTIQTCNSSKPHIPLVPPGLGKERKINGHTYTRQQLTDHNFLQSFITWINNMIYSSIFLNYTS